MLLLAVVVGVATWLVHKEYPWAALAWVVAATALATLARRYAPVGVIAFSGLLAAVAGLYPLIPTTSEFEPPAVPPNSGRSEVSTAEASTADLSNVGARSLNSPVLVTRVKVGKEPFAVSTNKNEVWVANSASDSLTLVDANAGRVVRTVKVAPGPVSVATAGRSAWVVSNESGSVSRVGARRGRIVWSTSVSPNPSAMLLTDDQVWVADAASGAVHSIDRRKGEVRGQVQLSHEVYGATQSEDGLWFVGEGQVTLVDPERGRTLRHATLEKDVIFAAFGVGGLWLSAPSENRVYRMDPDSMEITDTLVIEQFPSGLAADERSLWITATNSNRLIRVDLGTRTVVGHARTGSQPIAVAVARNRVVVADEKSGTLSIVQRDTVARGDDPTPTLTTVRLTSQPVGLTSGFGSIWVTDADDGTLIRLDPGTMTREATVKVGGKPLSVVAAFGSIWVGSVNSNQVTRVNPDTNEVTEKIDVARGPSAMVAASGALWVSAFEANVLQRINPHSLRVDVISVGDRPLRMAAGAGGLWVTSGGDGAVELLNTAKLSIDSRIDVSNVVGGGIAAEGNSVWVTAYDMGELVRIDARTRAVTARIRAAPEVYDVLLHNNTAWVTAEGPSSLTRIDVNRQTVTGSVKLADFPQTLALSGDAVWIASTHGGAVQRLMMQ